MAHNLPQYRPSGFFRPLGPVLFLLAAVAGTLLAGLYQGLMNLIPFVYINMLICAAFGAALGFGGMWAVKTGHCRNRMIGLLFALPLAALPVGASYYWDYRHLLSEVEKQTPEMKAEEIRQAIPFGRYFEVKREAGWKIKSIEISGVGVIAMWGVEALIVFVIALGMVYVSTGNPYCERCNRWGEARVLRIAGLGRAQVDPLLSKGDLDAVIALQAPPEADASTGLEFTGTLCGGCADTGFLTVEEKLITTDKKGKSEEKSSTLVEHAMLNPGQRAQLEARFGQASRA
ncbi:MAG: hypothetical protein FD180_2160 [Planctomycetota bacterium]|nr:MAG: hypothetical protein FD180_2160 [Planctomycetota bacterium]